MGYLEVEPIQVGISFTLLPRRHKKKPTLITSNLGKTHCHRLFPLPIATPWPCAAISFSKARPP